MKYYLSPWIASKTRVVLCRRHRDSSLSAYRTISHRSRIQDALQLAVRVKRIRCGNWLAWCAGRRARHRGPEQACRVRHPVARWRSPKVSDAASSRLLKLTGVSCPLSACTTLAPSLQTAPSSTARATEGNPLTSHWAEARSSRCEQCASVHLRSFADVVACVLQGWEQGLKSTQSSRDPASLPRQLILTRNAIPHRYVHWRAKKTDNTA